MVWFTGLRMENIILCNIQFHSLSQAGGLETKWFPTRRLENGKKQRQTLSISKAVAAHSEVFFYSNHSYRILLKKICLVRLWNAICRGQDKVAAGHTQYLSLCKNKTWCVRLICPPPPPALQEETVQLAVSSFNIGTEKCRHSRLIWIGSLICVSCWKSKRPNLTEKHTVSLSLPPYLTLFSMSLQCYLNTNALVFTQHTAFAVHTVTIL